MKTLMFGLLLSASAIAGSNDLAHRPRAFSTPQGKAVFVDFSSATYNITYDISSKKASVRAEMEFDAPEAGLPIFDSVTEPTSVILDGKGTTAPVTATPENETTLRVIQTAVSPGSHKLVVEMPLSALVQFDNGVKSAFWTSDLSERQYLERYMPASFEYDQMKIVFNVKFIGAKSRQEIYTNGVVEELAEGAFRIKYPDYFNASSIFFHTVPQGAVDTIRYSLKSVDGRDIPVTIYTGKSIWGGDNASTLERFKNEATSVFHELEGDYGAWPHAQLVIYNAGSGGMEYCGATITEFRALGHEMFHSYFARGVMPANGNSGWLDEALASWRDNGYKTSGSLSGTSMMSSHPYYTRITDRAAYSFGENFMRLMDGKLKAKGGLKPFMRHMVDNRAHAPLFVEEFIKEMESFTGVAVEADFRRYTFGTRNSFEESKHKANPIHRKLSLKELESLL